MKGSADLMSRPPVPVVVLVVAGVFASALATAATIDVAAGGDLQVALVNARPGDVIQLAEGATFKGNFTLPRKEGGDAFITVRTKDATAGTSRVGPDNQFATLRADNGAPVLQTSPGAHHWRIEMVEISGAGDGDLVRLGDGSEAQTALSQVPHDLVVDRVYIHGDPARGVKRCVALNSAATVISNSYVSDCKAADADSQAIAGWNGPGPYSILNNYLEGAGENVLFGGADPSIRDLVPTDITIRGNLISKPTAWRSAGWQVKNLLELKNARRVTITENVFEYSWQAAQQGFAVLFTVRNQDGRCPWCQVEEVTFTSNTVRHVAQGFEILGFDDSHPSRQARAITIRDNVVTDLNPAKWGGNGAFLLVLGAPREITIDHNTIIQDNAAALIQVEGPPIISFTFTNNLASASTYGIIGADRAPGKDSIGAFFPASLVAGNVIAGVDSSHYPTGNRYPAMSDFQKQFVGYNDGNYQLVVGSAFRNAGTDGSDVGARFSTTTTVPDPPDVQQLRRRSGRPQ